MAQNDTFQKGSIRIRDKKAADRIPKYIAGQFWIDLRTSRDPICQLKGQVQRKLRPWFISPYLQLGKMRCRVAQA